jgi:hypothetical protein
MYLLNDLALLGGEVLQFGVDALALALVFGELLVHRLGLLVLRLQRRLQRRDPLLPLQLLRSAMGGVSRGGCARHGEWGELV